MRHDDDDDKALVSAAECGDLEAACALLKRGARVDATQGSPLRGACASGNVALVSLLLGRGASPCDGIVSSLQLEKDKPTRWRDDRGRVHALIGAPLRNACAAGHAPVVRLLLDSRADVTADDFSALRWAASADATEVMQMLLDHISLHRTKITVGQRWIADEVLCCAASSNSGRGYGTLRPLCESPSALALLVTSEEGVRRAVLRATRYGNVDGCNVPVSVSQ